MVYGGYRRLKVWQKGMDLVEEVYRLTAKLPPDERFELCAQLRAAAVSIPSNVAEGDGRLHQGDYVRHLSIARGSLMELQTQLEAAVRVGHLTRNDVRAGWSLCEEVGKMLTKMIQRMTEK